MITLPSCAPISTGAPPKAITYHFNFKPSIAYLIIHYAQRIPIKCLSFVHCYQNFLISFSNFTDMKLSFYFTSNNGVTTAYRCSTVNISILHNHITAPCFCLHISFLFLRFIYDGKGRRKRFIRGRYVMVTEEEAKYSEKEGNIKEKRF